MPLPWVGMQSGNSHLGQQEATLPGANLFQNTARRKLAKVTVEFHAVVNGHHARHARPGCEGCSAVIGLPVGLTSMFNKDTPKHETCVSCVGWASTRHGRLKSALRHAILVGCGRCFTLRACSQITCTFGAPACAALLIRRLTLNPSRSGSGWAQGLHHRPALASNWQLCGACAVRKASGPATGAFWVARPKPRLANSARMALTRAKSCGLPVRRYWACALCVRAMMLATSCDMMPGVGLVTATWMTRSGTLLQVPCAMALVRVAALNRANKRADLDEFMK